MAITPLPSNNFGLRFVFNNLLPEQLGDLIELPEVAFYTPKLYCCPKCGEEHMIVSFYTRAVVECACGQWLDVNLTAKVGFPHYG